ncbi:hypothetical protein Pmani_019479 [Petrolisthes manimaculis]|uniref:Uncharacterized protein n=1 Tax=Petrolisthes manimaculis TaxID=1843537 RepID=A0AAE1PKB7_9EUCA|nr:hypothetical protein Pmani_019479 [Petrolisthes manimaculis]
MQEYGKLLVTVEEVQADHVGIALSTADPPLPLPLPAVPYGSTTVIAVLQPQPQPMSTPFLEANTMLQQLDMVMGTVIRLHINNNYKCLLHNNNHIHCYHPRGKYNNTSGYPELTVQVPSEKLQSRLEMGHCTNLHSIFSQQHSPGKLSCSVERYLVDSE